MKETWKLIKSDLQRYGVPPVTLNILKHLLIGNSGFKFSFWMRMCRNKNILFPIFRLMYNYYKNKYGLQIPYTTQIGYGLYLGHGINIVINQSAKIGNNCNLSQGCTIGSNYDNAAVIGNNVYIGPNVCIVENVHIGNQVTIGAGAVVVKNVEDNLTVAGNPAKVISEKDPARFIMNPYEL